MYEKIQKEVLNGVKVPHETSQPVIRMQENKYYLAVFVFYYSKADIEKGMVSRPEVWALADLNTGEIVHEYFCKKEDFSDASYDIKYNIRMKQKCDTSKKYYDISFAILDKVREEVQKTGKIPYGIYKQYMERILANVPAEYQRFYLDLSIKVD